MFRYVIICAGAGRWLVGLNLTGGQFQIESEHFTEETARIRCNILNGMREAVAL